MSSRQESRQIIQWTAAPWMLSMSSGSALAAVTMERCGQVLTDLATCTIVEVVLRGITLPGTKPVWEYRSILLPTLVSGSVCVLFKEEPWVLLGRLLIILSSHA